MNADTVACPRCGAPELWSTTNGHRAFIGYQCMYEVEACAYAAALRSLATRLRDALRDAHEIADDPNNMMRWHDVLADADALLKEGHNHA